MSDFNNTSSALVSTKWTISSKPAPACYLCGQPGEILYRQQRDRLYAAPGIWDIRICRRCGLAWLDPRPDPEAISTLYVGYSTHVLNTALHVFAGVPAAIGNAVLAARLGYRELSKGRLHLVLGWLASWLPIVYESVQLSVMGLAATHRGRLIDVGCGNGAFLARMRDLGWTVAGVEPDPEAVRIARDYFGLSIFQGTLAEANFPEVSTDVITMHHVLEHVFDPIGLLLECYRILRPGGILIAVTPNLESLGRHIFKSYWRGWEVPRHIFVFSPHAVKHCFKQAGLRVIAVWTSVRMARWMWRQSRLLKSHGKLVAESGGLVRWWLRLEGLVFQFLEGALRNIRPCGEEIVVVAKKETEKIK